MCSNLLRRNAGEYGERVSHNTSSFSNSSESAESAGFTLDYSEGREQRDMLLAEFQ